MDGVALLERARAAGLRVWSEGDQLVIRGPRVAESLALSLIEHKVDVLPLVGFVPWLLAEWRRASTPHWRHVLVESITKGDKGRADYARWMLREILLDPEYVDGQ